MAVPVQESESSPRAPRLEEVLRVHAPVLLRSAAALELAAEQLRDATRAAAGVRSVNDLRSGCLTAFHAALSAYEVLGRFEFAAELEEKRTQGGDNGGAAG